MTGGTLKKNCDKYLKEYKTKITPESNTSRLEDLIDGDAETQILDLVKKINKEIDENESNKAETKSSRIKLQNQLFEYENELIPKINSEIPSPDDHHEDSITNIDLVEDEYLTETPSISTNSNNKRLKITNDSNNTSSSIMANTSYKKESDDNRLKLQWAQLTFEKEKFELERAAKLQELEEKKEQSKLNKRLFEFFLNSKSDNNK